MLQKEKSYYYATQPKRTDTGLVRRYRPVEELIFILVQSNMETLSAKLLGAKSKHQRVVS